MSIPLALLGAYLLPGLAFAVPFAWLGAGAIDPAARNATTPFRILILPGCAIFWPFLLVRWIRNAPPPEERSRHRQPQPND